MNTLQNIRTPRELAEFLGESYSNLVFFAYRASDEQKYRVFSLPKKTGGVREIASPIGGLRRIHRKLLVALSPLYQEKACCHGFIEKRGIVTNAKPHVRKRHVLNFDLLDFFPTITMQRIRGLLSSEPYSLEREVASWIAKLCTRGGRLPQGACTSPLISNMLCRKLDRQLATLAAKHRTSYTRYADDITFSTNLATFPDAIARKDADGEVDLGAACLAIVANNGFLVNPRKTRLQGNDERQSVTGITVNERMNVPRRLVRRARAMLHDWKRNGYDDAQLHFSTRWDKKSRYASMSPDFVTVVGGLVSYIAMVRRASGLPDQISPRLISDFRQLASDLKSKRRKLRTAAVASGEYSQPEKELARQEVLEYAIKKLQVGVEWRPNVEQHFLALMQLLSARMSSSAEAEIRRRFFELKTMAQRRTPKPDEMRALYLCGPSPVNDYLVLRSLGLEARNIVGVEVEAKDFRRAEQQRRDYGITELHLLEGKLENIIAEMIEPFDLVYYDGCRAMLQPPRQTLDILNALRSRGLAPVSALVTNFSFDGSGSTPDERWLTRLRTWSGNEVVDIGAAYSQFVPQFFSQYTNFVGASLAVLHVGIERYRRKVLPDATDAPSATFADCSNIVSLVTQVERLDKELSDSLKHAVVNPLNKATASVVDAVRALVHVYGSDDDSLAANGIQWIPELSSVVPAKDLRRMARVVFLLKRGGAFSTANRSDFSLRYVAKTRPMYSDVFLVDRCIDWLRPITVSDDLNPYQQILLVSLYRALAERWKAQAQVWTRRDLTPER